MAYAQVRDIVWRVQELRGVVLASVEQANPSKSSDISRLLLERIKHHDRVMQRLAGDELEKADPDVLNTWIQYPGVETLQKEVAALKGEGLPGVAARGRSDAIQTLLELDRRLLNVYETASDQSSSPRVKAFFEALAFMEEQNSRLIGRNVVEAQDL